MAGELDCHWHTVNDAVATYGEALFAADTGCVGAVYALGLNESLFVRTGRFRRQSWRTSVVDATAGRRCTLVEVIEGRTARGWRPFGDIDGAGPRSPRSCRRHALAGWLAGWLSFAIMAGNDSTLTEVTSRRSSIV